MSEQWWRSPDERDGRLEPHDTNEAIRSEFLPVENVGATRRSFLKAVGFGIAGAAAAGCTRGPVRKAIPYLVAPEEIVPGQSYWIATTCTACEAGCGALAKCMDGRPVKLEGNPESSVSGGGLCASGQASILSLYDSHRLSGPHMRKERGSALASASWKDVDAEIARRIAVAKGAGGRVRVLTRTVHSPSTRAMIARFLGEFADGEHVMYDQISCAAILDAHEKTHGVRSLPHYRFEKARLIVSFDADFLGTWISPVEFTRGWAAARDPESAHMARHVHFEARMSLSGSRADERVRLAPWETGAGLAALCSRIAKRAGTSGLPEQELPAKVDAAITQLAGELWQHRGRALVVCGSNELAHQLLVNRINELLGGYGETLDLTRPSLQVQGSDTALRELLAELERGEVDLLIVQGANPLYELPGVGEAFAKAGSVIRVGEYDDETCAVADVLCPEPHGLAAWGDAEPRAGELHLMQPTLPPVQSARTLREHLARWLGDEREDRLLLRDHWKEHVFPRAGRGGDSFDAFFERALERGSVSVTGRAGRHEPFDGGAVAAPPEQGAPSGALGLVLYPSVGLRDGRHAHNPWLQELPDPVTKIVWDNYASLSPATADRLGVAQGDVVRLQGEGDAHIDIPVHVQPGQHDGVVAVAIGYGRKGTDRFAGIGPEWLEARPTVALGALVGTSAAALTASTTVEVTKRNAHVALACTQDHHSLSVPAHLAPASGAERDTVRTATLADWKSHGDHAFGGHDSHPAAIWPDDHRYEGHRWTMAVDLSACTGCSACVVACQSENNVPVVGKDEVRRHREMSWIRIDRYYKGEGDDVETVHQPMMCQHCANAPCETVCPVLATVHSSEGLNQQVYNRCVGTRYCANNCPYKTRRFNWFDYPHEDRLQNMALNPDVTIRSRGVMEKCSMCVQRIQAAKAAAKRDGRALGDGDIRVACEQSCPSQAIVFGDGNDSQSRVSRKLASKRAYTVLAELGVKPGVHYLGVVRNTGEGGH